MPVEPCMRTVRWIAIAGAGLIAALALHAGALAQTTTTRHITALPPALAPRPSMDPVDLLASADALGFTSGQSVSGEVRELSTGRPLANVWVIAVWEASGLSGYVCFDADTSRSDPAGHFELTTWRHTLLNLGAVSDQRLRLFVYRPSYELVRLERRQVLLRPLQDSPGERLAALREIDESALYCPPGYQQDRAHDAHFQPLLLEMASEAQGLPDEILGRRAFLTELRQQLARTKAHSH